ncbi:TPA: hypothetical protein ACG0AF_000025 [Enterobacter hormaechei subsp. steigerwaltii]
MITLTKEWLQQTIAELEEERDATPGAVNEDAAMALAAMKLALASLEAEPVTEWTNEQCLEFLSIAFRHAEIKGDLELDDIRLGVKMVNGSRAAMLQGDENAESPTTMQTAPDVDSSPKISESYTGINQGKSEPVTTAYKLPEGWVAVPVDATRAMIDAARRVEEDGYDAMHKAMIAAAPQQEVK